MSNDERLERLALDLPPGVIEVIRLAAIESGQRGAAAYVRDLIAHDPGIKRAAHLMDVQIPDLSRSWGGRRVVAGEPGESLPVGREEDK